MLYTVTPLKRMINIIFRIFPGASYMLGRALTSTAWGMIADRIGRKPVIVIGIFSALVLFVYVYTQI